MRKGKRNTKPITKILAALLSVSLAVQGLPLDALAAETASAQTEIMQTEEQQTEQNTEIGTKTSEAQEEQPEETVQGTDSESAEEEEILETAEAAETTVLTETEISESAAESGDIAENDNQTEIISETSEEMTEKETNISDVEDMEEQSETEIDNHEAILVELEERIRENDSVLEQVNAINADGFQEKYGLTYQDLLFRCPEYLENADIEEFLNVRFEYAGEIWGEAAVNEDTAKIMHNIKQGVVYNIKTLLGDKGIGQTEYEKFQVEIAKSVVKDYLRTDTAASGYYKEVAENLSKIDKVYDVMDDDKIDEYASKMSEACKYLSKKDIEDIVENVKYTKSFMKYAGDASTAFKLCSSIIAMQELDIGAVELLIESYEPYQTDNELYKGLCLLKEQLEYDPAAYVLANYCTDKVLETIADALVEYSADALFGGGAAAVVAVVKVLGKAVAGVYELFNPSYQEIKYAEICFCYYMNAESVQRKYQKKFKQQKTAKARDEILYEAVSQIRFSCLRVFLKNAKSCTNSKSKQRKLQTYYDNVDDMDFYSTYINACMEAASKALKNGTVELKDVVIRKTDKGQVLDETYDSTESIKAKYAEIQKKYPPDVNQTWKESYGGAIQCFGFARMVFYLLFGCDMPSAYQGSKRYEYINNNNVTIIGQLSGSEVTAENMKTLVSQGKLGDVTQGYGVPYGQHTMILQEVTDTGATFYQCNYLNEDCLIYTGFYTWEYLANRYGEGDSTSGNGFTLYRADNYGMIYGDGSDLFYDDSVNFVIEDGVLIKYNGWQSHVEIPDTVTAIGDGAFKNNTTMMTVSIPDSVTSIGNEAFYGCTNLVGVVIPDSVLTIGYSAFQNCSSLASVQLSNSVTSIGYWAFRDCDRLKKIEIPKSLETTTYQYDWQKGYGGIFYDCNNLKTIVFEEGITKIVNAIFANCNGIEEIEIPNTVTDIEELAFYNCINLKSVKISNSVVSIDYSVFANCSSLENVQLSNRITSIGHWAFRNCKNLKKVEIPKSSETTTYQYDWQKGYGGIFYDCNNLKTIVFEEGITKIVNALFANCSGIEEIEIPDTVTDIEELAFYNCVNLKSIKISNSVTSIDYSVFENCSSLENVQISNRITSIGHWAFKNCESLKKIEIPKSLKITTYQYDWQKGYGGIFNDCNNLKTVVFEEGTTEIVNALFANCNGIEKIEIPNTVVSIEELAFYNCENLKEITIFTGVETIGTYAFAYDSSLLEINIPNTVTSMGDYTFSGCTSLKTAKLPNISVNIVDGMFKDCTNLKNIEIPKTVTTIKQYAFQNSGITELTLPENVTTIESYAFDGCTNLAKINFNPNLKTIGNYAFRNNDALTELTIPTSVTTIGEYAFQDSDALTTATISDSVTSIGQYIFAHCDSLKDVTLGTGLTKIPAYAFNLCPALTKIVLPYRITTVDANAFTNCTKLTEVTIPRGATTISTSAFSYPDRLTIYGIAGTYAETYANQIGATFVNREVNATDVTLSSTTLSMITGAKHTLVMSVTPSDFTDEVVWKSSDTNVITVDNMGIITAKAVGTANVRVAVGEKTASCAVTVVQPVTSISLSKSTLSLDAFADYTLTASVYPDNAADKSVEWTTSDEKIATVSQTGKVTPLSKGTATIRVTAKDGSGKYAQCTVTVTSEGQLCTQYSQLESEHNYANNTNKVWKYVYSGAKTLEITFDSKTNADDGFDFIYIYDKDNTEIKKATGTALAGQTIQITGDTVKIKLVSDEAITAWGFKVTNISADGKIIDADEEKPEDPETSSEETSTEESSVEESSVEESSIEEGSTEELSTEENSTEEPPIEEPSTEESSIEESSVEENSTEESSEPDETIKDGLFVTGLETQTYTGTAIKPNIRVYYNKHLLQEGTDYTLSYKNNKNVGKAFVTVKSKKNLKGSVTKTFQIEPRKITDTNIIIEDTVYLYNKKPHKKAPVITFNGKKLKEGRDFEVAEYGTGDFMAIGTYTVKIKGIGNFTGSFDNAKVIIADKDKNISKAKITKIPVQEYKNGAAIELPDNLIQVQLNKTILQKDIDYTVSYTNNVNAGKATLIIRGTGSYAGTKSTNFTIKRKPVVLTDSMITNKSSINSAKIQKNGAMPKPRLVSDNDTLAEGIDYTLSYTNNKKTGIGIINIKGKGNYKGHIRLPFQITTKDLTDTDITIRVPDVPYTEKPNKYQSIPTLTDTDGGILKINKDYTIETYYDGNTALNKMSSPKEGTVLTVVLKGRGSYTGTVKANYTLKGQSFSQVSIKIAPKSYTGSPVTIEASDILSAVIKNGKIKTSLNLGTDYEIAAYRNNLKKGTATITFRGIGAYSGEKTVKFKINSASIE